MKALLMAAGRGTRISRYLNGNPKCTVDIRQGLPLIRYTINMLKKKGINEIMLVTGYRHEVIEKLLGDDVLYTHNPFFDVTNSIASAWFAQDFIADDDMLIMNADVFCEEAAYDEMLKIRETPVMLMDTTRIEEADYKFFCENGNIKKYGKELTPEETTGEYVGIGFISRDFVPRFKERMNAMINRQQHDVWWENILYSMSDEIDLHAYDLAGKFWAEVDYIEDYERIKDFVKKNESL